MRSRRALVLATDAAFALPTAVAAASLQAVEGGDVELNVLCVGLSNDLRRRFLAAVPSPHLVRWISMDEVHIGASHVGHLPEAAYFRLFAPHLLSDDVDRLIYVDSDIIARDAIEPLWHLDLQGHVVGAVRSVNFPSIATRGAVDHWRALGLSPTAPFLNSGLLVIDTKPWIDEQVTERSMEHARSSLLGSGADQQSLNVALNGKWYELGPEWNQQPSLLDDQHGAHLMYSDAVIERARADPKIVHFQDRPKPWQPGCQHPRRDEWVEAAESSGFGWPGVPRRNPIVEARRRVRRAAYAVVYGR